MSINISGKALAKLISLFILAYASGCQSNFAIQTSHPSRIPTEDQISVTPTLSKPAFTQTSQNHCTLSNDIQQIKSKGQIVFQDYEKGLYFYNVSNGQNQIIPNTTNIFLPFVASSPDHERVAFFDVRSEKGGVISSNGSIAEINTKDKINGIFYGWADNQKIIFVDRAHSDGSVITLDVDKGIIQKISTGIKELIALGPNRWYAGGEQSSVIFDPTLTRMIYLTGELPNELLGNWGFIVRDRETQEILWAGNSSDLGIKPKWSPSGQYAIVPTTGENEDINQITIISRDGQEVKKINTTVTGLDNMEWSPDELKIGFTFFSDKPALGVYNLNSGVIQKFTVQQEGFPIIWSPDGNQIAIKGSIVDLSTSCIYTLNPNDNSGPLAWINSN